MRNTLAIALLLAAAAHAQETTVYRLSFAVHEIETGKTEHTRNFTMTVAPREQQRLNIGTKLPVPTASGGSQFTYVDVGVSLRARIVESGAQLLLNAEVEASGLSAEQGGLAPRIQQMKATIDTAIPLDKATRVVAMDDPVGPKHYEIEVTASKVK